VRCVDADPVNQTLSEYQGLAVSRLNLLKAGSVDQREFDLLIEKLLTENGTFVVDTGASTFIPLWLPLPKMLSGANAFEISDIERMNIGAHQPGVWHVTMLHALWLAEITIRQGQRTGSRRLRERVDRSSNGFRVLGSDCMGER
jgi:hypothetical protein